jgi:hypothetical protein
MSRPLSNLPSDLAFCLLTPPIAAFAWWLLSKGWTSSLGTSNDPVVEGWTSDGWKYVLGILYAIAASMLVYAYFIKG